MLTPVTLPPPLAIVTPEPARTQPLAQPSATTPTPTPTPAPTPNSAPAAPGNFASPLATNGAPATALATGQLRPGSTSAPSAPNPPVAFGLALPSLRNGEAWPVAWSNVWVPLETWSRRNGLGSPTQVASGPEASFVVGTPAGMFRLKPGSQVASLLGEDCLIAHPPRLVGGVPYMHALDLQKTLQPALNGTLDLPPGHRVIVIDPGHGGRDSGTKNAFGPNHEKVYTLDWAHRLEAILAGHGWTVVLTRTNDADVPLADRVAIAERAQASIFLSLHFNSGQPSTEMNGLETYCLTPVGLPSNLRRDFDDDPRQIHPNNTYDQANFLLASRLHRSLLQVTGATDRGVRRARFMTVLRGQNRPAVLIEGGYLSNPTESRRIATPAYRQLLAEAVAQVLSGPGASPGPIPAGATTSASASAHAGAAAAAARP